MSNRSAGDKAEAPRKLTAENHAAALDMMGLPPERTEP